MNLATKTDHKQEFLWFSGHGKYHSLPFRTFTMCYLVLEELSVWYYYENIKINYSLRNFTVLLIQLESKILELLGFPLTCFPQFSNEIRMTKSSANWIGPPRIIMFSYNLQGQRWYLFPCAVLHPRLPMSCWDSSRPAWSSLGATCSSTRTQDSWASAGPLLLSAGCRSIHHLTCRSRATSQASRSRSRPC